MPQPTDTVDSARTLLTGRDEIVVLSAMWPAQPDVLLRAFLDEALRADIRLTVLAADVSGRWPFVRAEHVPALEAGKLALVSLAGAVPRHLAAHIDHFPSSMFDIERQLANGRVSVDVFVARVGRVTDGPGFVLGDMIGYTPAALDRARSVGFEVSDGVTRVGGYPPVDADRPTTVCSGPAVLPVTAAPTASAIHDRIGALSSDLLPGDATLQLGLGSVPEALVPHLTGKPRLGLHTGVMPATLRSLIRDGAFSAAAKTDRKGEHVATGVMPGPDSAWGDQLVLESVAITHSPEVLARQYRLWALNSAFEVDLFGQSNAEYVDGVRAASGGGQADFLRAAHLSDGGGAVLMLPARTRSGRSRIVARLGPPHHTTSASGDLDFVVTEYGVARLTGATVSQRAERLIAIAHPDDRGSLRRA